ncbi:hypothetical protein [Streptomyces johnsoniae]|uniref:ABC-2 type transport system permease protein n=1 Tax=Streptomyces johnsoniae TaxID=3075532 RepID=A0ABU2S6R5_9ACTN|nr:hypothetical protein [Streptomyces sp. DSM 41886]MDT0444607.1 hypothetical protein [Streptomyces sp. DSM 41886]
MTAPEALRWLRARRGAARRRTSGYAAYVTLVLLTSWYGLYAIGLAMQISRDGGPFPAHEEAVREALPFGAVAAGLVALCLIFGDALWRGPVLLPRPDADWLLPMPVPRWPLLRPWFLLSLGLLCLGALLAGLGLGLVLAAARLGDPGPLILACTGPAVCLALLAVAGAVAVQRFAAAARLARAAAGPALLGALLLAVLAARDAAEPGGGAPEAVRTAVLWSGPWGWAAQPALAAAGTHPPYWQAAAALLAAAAAVALVPLPRLVRGMPAAVLRTRSRAVGRVAGGLLAMDLRTVRLAMAAAATGAARGAGPPGRLARLSRRLRPPRRLWLAVLWRDTVALLGAPRRPAAALLLLAAAFTAAAATTAASGAAALVPTALAVCLGHAAAARLVETARLDADDPRRAAQWWPRSAAALTLAHAVVPTAVLLLAGLPFAVPLDLTTGVPAVSLLFAAAPVLTAGALMAVHRPVLPGWVLHSGMLGASGPALAATWYAAGPLTAVTGLTVLLTPQLSGGTAAWPAFFLCWSLAAALLAGAWSRARRAGRGR